MISLVALLWLALFGCCLAQKAYAPYTGPPVVPVILPGGFLADTQEVAAAKNYHLNVLNQAATGTGPKAAGHGYHNAKAYQPPQSDYRPVAGRHQEGGGGQRPAYKAQQAPLFTKPLYEPLPQHYTRSQPQAAYRPKLQQAYRSAAPVQEADDYDDGQYREVPLIYTTARPDPLVTPKILDNGYIADTQEVDAAKAEHFAAVARAQEAVARAQQEAAAKAAAEPQAAPSPPRGYDAPARGYDAPSRGYDTPNRGYDAPSKSYDGPSRGQDAPSRGYDDY